MLSIFNFFLSKMAVCSRDPGSICCILCDVSLVRVGAKMCDNVPILLLRTLFVFVHVLQVYRVTHTVSFTHRHFLRLYICEIHCR